MRFHLEVLDKQSQVKEYNGYYMLRQAINADKIRKRFKRGKKQESKTKAYKKAVQIREQLIQDTFDIIM